MAKLKETTVRENLYVKGDVYVWDFELGQYKLLFAPATETTLGGIIVGNNLTIDAKGVLNSTRQPVDKELSLLSANPVENQTITRALNLKVDTALASSAATATNQLMDRESVQTLITTNNAVFRGSFDTWALVPIDSEKYLPDEEGNKEPKKNDYMIVNDAGDYHEGGVSGKEGTWRFIYIGNWRTEGKLGWQPQYKMSDSFTPAQKAALNSNITAQKVEKYDAYDAQIQNRSLLGHTHPAAQVDGLKPIATSGEYKDLYNVPTAGNTSTPVYFGTDPTTKTGRPYTCNISITAAGAANKPVYFKADGNGVFRPYACDVTLNKNVGSSTVPIYINASGVATACSIDLTVPTVKSGTPTTSSPNGWYKCSKTINGYNHTWMILKIGSLFIAHSLNDARIVFQSVNNTNWYSPYASWHA